MKAITHITSTWSRLSLPEKVVVSTAAALGVGSIVSGRWILGIANLAVGGLYAHTLSSKKFTSVV